MFRPRGFTLIELLVVIAIIGILSTVVLASLNLARSKGRISAGMKADAQFKHALPEVEGGWLFDECSGTTANDGSGSDRSGTLVNSPVWSTDTPSGKGCSLLFNGTNSYVSLPTFTFPANTPITITAWVKPTAGAGPYPMIVDNETGIGVFMGIHIGGGGNVGYNIYLTSTLQTQNKSAPVLDEWHFIAGSYDGSYARLYVDGVLVSKSAGPAAWGGFSGNMMIGNGQNAGNSYWKGNIDDVHVYSSVFSASEVQRLYAQEAGQSQLAVWATL